MMIQHWSPQFAMEVVEKLILAVILASFLGIERDMHGRSAGWRTHVLICMGCTLFLLISLQLWREFGGDMSRIPGQIVTGIGFLGAGVIIKTGLDVRGLTTAACIWVDAAIGTAVGLGMYEAASILAIMALLMLIVLNRLETYYKKKTLWQLKICLKDDTLLQDVINCVSDESIKVLYVEQKYNYQRHIVEFTLRCNVRYRKTTYQQQQHLRQKIEQNLTNVLSLEWNRTI